MLKIEQKKHIDNACDVLSVKLASPNAQIEQITWALIYKFLCDMDRMSTKNGGKPTIFVGDLFGYSWEEIKSCTERDKKIKKYRYGLEKLSSIIAKDYQTISRIFQNATLPYNDERTLSFFMKEINYFKYEDLNEDKGYIYEYLLKILNKQPLLGQTQTPRNLISFMINVLKPKLSDKILDPACGTGGFLTWAYRYILKNNQKSNDSDEILTKKSEILTTNQRKALTKSITGYDISPRMARIAMANMWMHDFFNSSIEIYDTLTFDDKWEQKFDLILSTPPFTKWKGSVEPHSKFSVKSKKSEILFTDFIGEHLTNEGRAGIIVPKTVLFKKNRSYQELRQKLIEEWGLYAVVNLSSGSFPLEKQLDTSVLFLNKKISKKKTEILFLEAKNTQKNNNLLTISKIIKIWEKNESILSSEKYQLIKKEKILKNLNCELLGSLYEDVVKQFRNKNNEKQNYLAKLGDLQKNNKLEILRSSGPTQKDLLEHGENLCIHFTELRNNFNWKIDNAKNKTNKNGLLSKKGDVLLTSSHEHYFKCMLINLNNVVYGNKLFVLRQKENVWDPIFLTWLINFSKYKKSFLNLFKGSNVSNLYKQDLQNINLPVPSLMIQKKIINKFLDYQGIIKGLEMAVQNWNMHKIASHKWDSLGFMQNEEYVLKKLSNLEKEEKIKIFGGSGITKYDLNSDGNNLCIYCADLYNIYDLKIDKVENKTNKNGVLSKKGDVIMLGFYQNKFKSTVINLDNVIIGKHLIVLRQKEMIWDPMFLVFLINFSKFKHSFLELFKGSIAKDLSMTRVRNIELPVLPLQEQRRIASEFEEELKIEQITLNNIQKTLEDKKKKVEELFYF